MEMVLEFQSYPVFFVSITGFNPSSNGNGAGIAKAASCSLFLGVVSILLLMEMVLE